MVGEDFVFFFVGCRHFGADVSCRRMLVLSLRKTRCPVCHALLERNPTLVGRAVRCRGLKNSWWFADLTGGGKNKGQRELHQIWC